MTDEPKNETTHVRFPVGTTARIRNVLYGGEIQPAFIRTAVERELERREQELGNAARKPEKSE